MKKLLLNLMVIWAVGPGLGLPRPAGAWTASLEWSFPANGDTIEGFLIPHHTSVFHPQPAVDFAAGFAGFENPGWSGQVINPHYTVAQGPATDFFRGFLCSWSTNESVPFEMDWYAWSGGVLGTLEAAYRFSYDGSGGGAFWTDSSWSAAPYPLGADYDRSTAAPIPPSAALLASGLAGLGLLRKIRVSHKS